MMRQPVIMGRPLFVWRNRRSQTPLARLPLSYLPFRRCAEPHGIPVHYLLRRATGTRDTLSNDRF